MTLVPLLRQVREPLSTPSHDSIQAAYLAARVAARITAHIAAAGTEPYATNWDFCALALDDTADALHPWSTGNIAVLDPTTLIATCEPHLLVTELRELITALARTCSTAGGNRHPAHQQAWAAAADHAQRAATEMP